MKRFVSVFTRRARDYMYEPVVFTDIRKADDAFCKSVRNVNSTTNVTSLEDKKVCFFSEENHLYYHNTECDFVAEVYTYEVEFED